MEWGRLGHWTYIDRYTPEKTEPVPIYLFYLLLGHIASWAGMPTVWVFHLARSVLGAVALILWWQFCCEFTEHPKTAFVLGAWMWFGVFGNMATVFGQTRMSYTGLLAVPHYIVDMIAVIMLFCGYLKERALYSNAGGIGLGVVHPFLLALFLPVVLIHAGITGKIKAGIHSCLWAGLSAVPFVLPLFIAYQKVEWLKVWREQTACPFSLAGFELVYMVILTIALLLVGITALKSSGRLKKLAGVWIVLAVALALLTPIPNKREFTSLLSLPVGILTAPVVASLANRASKPYLMQAALVVLLCLPNIGSTLSVFVPDPQWAYIPKGLVEGFKWLEANSLPDDVAVCSWETGNYLPMYATCPRPWIGHSRETLFFTEKEKQAKLFFESKQTLPVQWAVINKKTGLYPHLKEAPAFENEVVVIWRTNNG